MTFHGDKVTTSVNIPNIPKSINVHILGENMTRLEDEAGVETMTS